MDLYSGAAFFDRQDFDCYDPVTGLWALAAFKGQLKTANTSVSPLNRATRIRMLFCTPLQHPTTNIIRVPSTAEIFLVGNAEGDSAENTAYRIVMNIHKAAGVATIVRLNPGVAGARGWAVPQTIQTTYGDSELRNLNTNQEQEIVNYGEFAVFLSADAPVQRHDTVSLNGKIYYIIETYSDSGFLACRSTVKPDERVNFVYHVLGAPVYNTATQTQVSANTAYNVTGKITLAREEQAKDTQVYVTTAKLMILEDFIDFAPKVNDGFVYLGVKYKVTLVSRDSVLKEWHLQGQEGSF